MGPLYRSRNEKTARFPSAQNKTGLFFRTEKQTRFSCFVFPPPWCFWRLGRPLAPRPVTRPPLHLLPPFNPKAGRAGWRGQIKSCRPARRKLYHCAGQKAQRHGLVSKSFVLLAGKTMISRSQRARGLQGRRADRESESGKHEEVPSDSAEPGKKAAMPST